MSRHRRRPTRQRHLARLLSKATTWLPLTRQAGQARRHTRHPAKPALPASAGEPDKKPMAGPMANRAEPGLRTAAGGTVTESVVGLKAGRVDSAAFPALAGGPGTKRVAVSVATRTESATRPAIATASSGEPGQAGSGVDPALSTSAGGPGAKPVVGLATGRVESAAEPAVATSAGGPGADQAAGSTAQRDESDAETPMAASTEGSSSDPAVGPVAGRVAGAASAGGSGMDPVVGPVGGRVVAAVAASLGGLGTDSAVGPGAGRVAADASAGGSATDPVVDPAVGRVAGTAAASAGGLGTDPVVGPVAGRVVGAVAASAGRAGVDSVVGPVVRRGESAVPASAGGAGVGSTGGPVAGRVELGVGTVLVAPAGGPVPELVVERFADRRVVRRGDASDVALAGSSSPTVASGLADVVGVSVACSARVAGRSVHVGRERRRRGGRPSCERCDERFGDRGSATLWVVGGLAVLMVVMTAVLWFGAAVVARHQAEGAADLAALAAASVAVDGERVACAEARWVVERMDAVLRSCRLSGWDAMVEVDVAFGPFGSAAGRARAGPVEVGG